MKKLGFVTLFALVIPLLYADPPATDSAPYHLTTVSWVVSTKDNLNVDDRYVTLIGRVTKKIHDGSYWFTDGTGSVRLDSDDKELPVGPKIAIGGRIDQAYLGIGDLEVDVRQWHYWKKP